MAAKLRRLGQLDHLKRQLGHLRRHLAPKVGHRTPFRTNDPDRASLRKWDLDPREGVGGGVIGTWQVSIVKWQTAKCQATQKSDNNTTVGSRRSARGRRMYIYVYSYKTRVLLPGHSGANHLAKKGPGSFGLIWAQVHVGLGPHGGDMGIIRDHMEVIWG